LLYGLESEERSDAPLLELIPTSIEALADYIYSIGVSNMAMITPRDQDDLYRCQPHLAPVAAIL
jgi:hypothetical protein